MYLTPVAIIPTLNAAKELKNQIPLLQTQTKKVSIVVIDSASTDNTLEIAKEQGIETRSIKRTDFNHATTRNIARKYDADFYLFMTQDAIPYDETLVENLLKPFEDPDVVVSYTRQIPHEGADAIEKFARETNYPAVSAVKSKASLPQMGIKTFFCSNSCAMYRADYFKKVGGFTDELNVNEDMEYAARAILDGKKIAYCADARVWHSHDYTLASLYRRYFKIGTFFADNHWIENAIPSNVNVSSAGIRHAISELRYLARNDPFLLPKSVIFSLTKYFAFQLGRRRRSIPSSLKKLLPFLSPTSNSNLRRHDMIES